VVHPLPRLLSSALRLRHCRESVLIFDATEFTATGQSVSPWWDTETEESFAVTHTKPREALLYKATHRRKVYQSPHATSCMTRSWLSRLEAEKKRSMLTIAKHSSL
jgi:hypothetical protein